MNSTDIDLLRRIRTLLARTIVRGRQRSCGIFLDRCSDREFMELLNEVDRRLGNQPEGSQLNLPTNLQEELRVLREYQQRSKTAVDIVGRPPIIPPQ